MGIIWYQQFLYPETTDQSEDQTTAKRGEHSWKFRSNRVRRRRDYPICPQHWLHLATCRCGPERRCAGMESPAYAAAPLVNSVTRRCRANGSRREITSYREIRTTLGIPPGSIGPTRAHVSAEASQDRVMRALTDRGSDPNDLPNAASSPGSPGGDSAGHPSAPALRVGHRDIQRCDPRDDLDRPRDQWCDHWQFSSPGRAPVRCRRACARCGHGSARCCRWVCPVAG